MVRQVYLAVFTLGCIATWMVSPALADKGKSQQAQKLIDEGKYKQAERHREFGPFITATNMTIDLVPGRTSSIPVSVAAGEVLSIVTSSPSGEISDSIVVLLAPDGTPVIGNDDFNGYYAGFDWKASDSGTYELLVTSFESIGNGQLVVSRN